MGINDLLLHGGIQNSKMAFSRLFDWIFLVIFPRHYFIQVDFVVQELIELEALEWFEHFLNNFLQIFNQRLVLYLQDLLRDQNVFLLNPLLLLFNKLDKYLRFVVFLLYPAVPQIYYLAKLVHAIRTSENFP